ncbi:MAG TPA: hypothetical protein VKX16_15010 [Chloroflexota bacterium]|nr:hypothetical protein [Chloroflexota bacterium]
MASDTDQQPEDNRARKIQGRAKRRRFVQGTRAYTHAVTNSIAKRAAKKGRDGSARSAPVDEASGSTTTIRE